MTKEFKNYKNKESGKFFSFSIQGSWVHGLNKESQQELVNIALKGGNPIKILKKDYEEINTKSHDR